jgi:hypothetical protein
MPRRPAYWAVLARMLRRQVEVQVGHVLKFCDGIGSILGLSPGSRLWISLAKGQRRVLARDLLPTPTRLIRPTAQQRHCTSHVVSLSARIRRRLLEIGNVSHDLLLLRDWLSRFLALQRHHLHCVGHHEVVCFAGRNA